MSVRYGPWAGGPDPLEPPYDVSAAVAEIGDTVLDGSSPREALQALLRRGQRDRRGLDALLREARARRREVRERGQLDGTLQQVRELLDRAVERERATLFPEPSDRARLAEQELDALPGDTARAVRQLADYGWTSEEARATYDEIRDLLRREVLDSQFRGMKDSLAGADPAELARVKDMLAALNAMLDADAQGSDTTAAFESFMQTYGDMFPDAPQTLEELVDALARRAAAAQRMMASLSREQRAELANLMAQAMGDTDLQSEMDRLRRALEQRRPDLDWRSGERMDGDEALGMGDATTALQDLADLDAVEGALHQDYAGATLDDVDLDAVARALGHSAVEDVRALQELERALAEQGYLRRTGGELELTPKAVRRIGATALARVFSRLDATGRGDHDVADAGAAGELTGGSREWRYGDEQPLDVVRTVRNAVLRRPPGTGRVALDVSDFEVIETERRTSAAVCLLVDLSYSMALRGTWGIAKSTALALHSLITTKYPQDTITIVGFSDYARELRPTDLAGLSWDMVQGTNLQHALMIAGRHLAKRPDAEQVVLVVTDGEPTAHLEPDGRPLFHWPPLPETVALTMAEVIKLTRRGATINVFMLDDEPRLVDFVTALARCNGGRVLAPAPDRLGDYVVSDYLRSRRGRESR
ncbi:MAG TPA: VWA domain-containing protein [Mycobacteriales bacterium]|nr:VWA domain-containing protein [Mycobacteriales bacterium]